MFGVLYGKRVGLEMAWVIRTEGDRVGGKIEQTECSETSAYKIQTPGNYPKESIKHSGLGESLKSKTITTFNLCGKYLMKHTKKISRSLLWEMKCLFPFVCNICPIGYKTLLLLTGTPAHHSPFF